MEASARETGLRARTAADDLETKGLARLRKGGDLSSDASSDLEAESDGSGEFDEAMLEGLDLNEGQGDRRDVGVLGEGTEERTLLDSQFEAVRDFLAGKNAIAVLDSASPEKSSNTLIASRYLQCDPEAFYTRDVLPPPCVWFAFFRFYTFIPRRTYSSNRCAGLSL